MQHILSPKYEHSKIEDPTVDDLIDVFEDLWVGYVFNPIEKLLNDQTGHVAAATLLFSYFEAIESYHSGESSENKSKRYFVAGFCRVFNSDKPGIEHIAEHIYKHVRCGLAHEGMLRFRVSYSPAGQKPIYATYPKNPDGTLNTSCGVESIIINVPLIAKSVRLHFDLYVKSLKNKTDLEMVLAFERTMRRLLGLGDGIREIIVGMTQDEFLGNS